MGRWGERPKEKGGGAKGDEEKLAKQISFQNEQG